jgi:hypothetical protein
MGRRSPQGSLLPSSSLNLFPALKASETIDVSVSFAASEAMNSWLISSQNYTFGSRRLAVPETKMPSVR